MLSTQAYRRVFRVSAWYDLIVTWPFAIPFTLALYWGGLLSWISALLGLPPLPALDVHGVLFANFTGSVVIVWSLARILSDDIRLARLDGLARLLFSAWMINALAQGATPLLYVFLLPEIGFGILQIFGTRAPLFQFGPRAKTAAE